VKRLDSIVSAEQAYLFRHSVLRDAAYQLWLPSERARLHEHALEALESFATMAVPAYLDSISAELALQATAALAHKVACRSRSRVERLRSSELKYRILAASNAEQHYRHAEAEEHWRTVSTHVSATAKQRKEALEKLAYSRFRVGETNEALAHFEALRKEAVQVDDLEYQTVALGGMAQCMRHLGRFDESETLQKRALALAIEQGNLKAEASQSGMLGILYETTGKIAQARPCQERTLEIARQLGEPRSEAMALGSLGTVNWHENRMAQARECYAQAFEIADKLGDRRMQGLWLSNLALIERGDKQLAKAHEMEGRALGFIRASGDIRLEASMCTGLAELLEDEGDHEASLGIAIKGLELARETQSLILEARALQAAGFASLALKRFGQARPMLEQAASLHETTKNLRAWAHCLCALGTALRELGMRAEATLRIQESLDIARRAGQKDMIDFVQQELAMTLERDAEVGEKSTTG
jgi:tetratricopeptide (TPR) repeat protein